MGLTAGIRDSPDFIDVPMTNIPNFVRDRLKAQTSASDHPDANLLTAFSEHTLVDPERAHVLAHLAQCADCRDVLAQALPPAEVQALVSWPAPSNSWLRGPVLRWASLAACVVVVAAAALLLQNKPPAATHSEVDVLLPAAPQLAPSRQPAPSKEEALPNTDKVSREAELKLVQPPAHETRNGAFSANKVGRSDREQLKDLDASKAAGNVAAAEPQAYDSLNRQVPAPVNNLRRDATVAGAPPQAAPVIGGSVSAHGQASAAMARMAVAPSQSALAANPGPPAASEAVEVTSGAVALSANAPAPASPGKAKAGSAAQLQTADAAGGRLAKKQLADTDTKISVLAAGSRWALSSQGQLQRSTDDGNTWEPVPVVENVTFRALSAFGNNIWVGGLAGMLYHSSDAGTHWTQVRPAANEVMLTGDIVSLRFADPQHGQLSTSTNETWITTDAGRTWSKNN